MSATRPPTQFSPESTDTAVNGSRLPSFGMGGTTGFAPVATITWSKPCALIHSGVAVVL